MKFFTVSTLSKIDYDFSVETLKHGAFVSFDAALVRLKEVVEKFKAKHQDDFETYSDEEEYPDEDSGALVVTEDYEAGYWCCHFGFEEHYENHQICIDEWEVEE